MENVGATLVVAPCGRPLMLALLWSPSYMVTPFIKRSIPLRFICFYVLRMNINTHKKPKNEYNYSLTR